MKKSQFFHFLLYIFNFQFLIILFYIVIYLQMSHLNKSKVISPIASRQKRQEYTKNNPDYQTQIDSTMYRSQTSQRRKPIFTTPDRNLSSQKQHASLSNTPQTTRNNKKVNFNESHLKQRIQIQQFPSRIGDSQQYQEEKEEQKVEVQADSQKKAKTNNYQSIKTRVFPETPIKKHFQKDQLSANRQFLNSKNSLFEQEQNHQQQRHRWINNHKTVNETQFVQKNSQRIYQKSQVIQQMKDLLYRMQTKNQTISFQIKQNERLKQQNQFLKSKNKELFAKLLKVQHKALDQQLIQNQNIKYKKNILKAKNLIINIESSDPQVRKQLQKVYECLQI